jgi:hypothetical protein
MKSVGGLSLSCALFPLASNLASPGEEGFVLRACRADLAERRQVDGPQDSPPLTPTMDRMRLERRRHPRDWPALGRTTSVVAIGGAS